MKRFQGYAGFTLLFTLGVILWGAYVRATGSGAGCGDHWPLCNGEVVPREAAVGTLIEFTHRTTSGLNLLLVVGMVFLARRAFPAGHAVRRGSAASLIFILLEAAVGAGLVLLKLVAQDSSALRAVVLAIHLFNTFLLVAALTWTWLASSGPVRGLKQWRPVQSGLLGALILVGITGAVTALGDTLFPSRTLQEGFAADSDPLSHFLIRLRIVHPALAMLTALGGFYAWQYGRGTGRARSWGNGFVALVCVQICLGFLNLALLAPVWTQLVHLALADAVWICAVAWTAAEIRS